MEKHFSQKTESAPEAEPDNRPERRFSTENELISFATLDPALAAKIELLNDVHTLVNDCKSQSNLSRRLTRSDLPDTTQNCSA